VVVQFGSLSLWERNDILNSAQGNIACSAEGAAFNSRGREAVGHMSKQIEARRADIFIGNVKIYAAPSALGVLGFA
jgi:hypothetical protein